MNSYTPSGGDKPQKVRKALEKSCNRMWSRNDVAKWVVQLSAELPLRCV